MMVCIYCIVGLWCELVVEVSHVNDDRYSVMNSFEEGRSNFVETTTAAIRVCYPSQRVSQIFNISSVRFRYP